MAAEKSLHTHQLFLRLQTLLLFKNYCSTAFLVNGSFIYCQELTPRNSAHVKANNWKNLHLWFTDSPLISGTHSPGGEKRSSATVLHGTQRHSLVKRHSRITVCFLLFPRTLSTSPKARSRNATTRAVSSLCHANLCHGYMCIKTSGKQRERTGSCLSVIQCRNTQAKRGKNVL